MDKIAAREDELLRQVAENLRPHGVRMVPQARRLGADRGDVDLAIQVGGRRLRYAATVKHGLRPATLGAVVHQLRRQPGRTS